MNNSHHNQHSAPHKKNKKNNHSLLIIFLAAIIIIAGIYLWRKRNAPTVTCQEICFSTTDEQPCDIICTSNK